jgi:hypothetical protein
VQAERLKARLAWGKTLCRLAGALLRVRDLTMKMATWRPKDNPSWLSNMHSCECILT